MGNTTTLPGDNQAERDALGLPPTESVIRANGQELARFKWQTGPVPEGRNGVTLEDMINECIIRLQGFNGTQFMCRENSLAITHLEIARNFLLQRTREREVRGVEGTLKP